MATRAAPFIQPRRRRRSTKSPNLGNRSRGYRRELKAPPSDNADGRTPVHRAQCRAAVGAVTSSSSRESESRASINIILLPYRGFGSCRFPWTLALGRRSVFTVFGEFSFSKLLSTGGYRFTLVGTCKFLNVYQMFSLRGRNDFFFLSKFWWGGKHVFENGHGRNRIPKTPKLVSRLI